MNIYDQSTQCSSSNFNKYELKQTIQQKEICFSLIFNSQNSMMISGCGENIKLWKIINGLIQNDPHILYGHTKLVTCLIYTNDDRCFISGSDDGDIRLWKKVQPNQWQSTTLTVHHQGVIGVLFNKSDQQIISFGKDPSIHIIKFGQQNIFQIKQTLNKHQSILNCLCMNESESILASSDYQKIIMIWVKDNNAQWQFKQIVNQSTNDYFCRMVFINNYLICQQWSKPISQVFIEVNGQFIQRPDLQIQLSEQNQDDEDLFPTIYNKKKGILIQKHGQFVYILKQLNNCQFRQVCPPINCIDQYNYGNLNKDGNNLIIWNYKTMEFRNYDLSLF
ncbi:unnamed protein product [Paramecium pentaurelia]|uniref:Uncharacterized protein n=1 Tax=Paramecium pentaurelia TaxID=43138 RepID=A0A8S1UF25_9CILI|nr:unnamed protein product [Paramecium pentaurelia]